MSGVVERLDAALREVAGNPRLASVFSCEANEVRFDVGEYTFCLRKCVSDDELRYDLNGCTVPLDAAEALFDVLLDGFRDALAGMLEDGIGQARREAAGTGDGREGAV